MSRDWRRRREGEGDDGTAALRPDGFRRTRLAQRRELGGARMNHWFDGDGMVQAFRFEGGASAAVVSHRGALLATPKLTTEEAAGRLLYSGFATTLANSPPLNGPDTLNPANINLLPLPGSQELFALWEAGSALALDPQTLQARGFKAWSPETQGAPFSAHPRTAPDGTVWNFGYVPGSGKLLVYEIAPDGRLRRQQVLDAPQADMVHDFAITGRHLVFLLMPLRFSGQPGVGAPLAAPDPARVVMRPVESVTARTRLAVASAMKSVSEAPTAVRICQPYQAPLVLGGNGAGGGAPIAGGVAQVG